MLHLAMDNSKGFVKAPDNWDMRCAALLWMLVAGCVSCWLLCIAIYNVVLPKITEDSKNPYGLPHHSSCFPLFKWLYMFESQIQVVPSKAVFQLFNFLRNIE
ncbi:hypothetical protein Peur_066472 [Populus x canadensis]